MTTYSSCRSAEPVSHRRLSSVFSGSGSNLSLGYQTGYRKYPSNQWIEQQHQFFATTNEVKIPKVIMQTWKTRRIPKHWRESPLSIKEHMPDWDYVLMTDEDNEKFCREFFPDFLPYYLDFPHAIQRADAIRYMWLYIHGGIYMDLDVVIVKPLDPLFYEEADLYLCSSGNIGSCLTNSFMASKPGCQMWLKMIEHMKKPKPAWAVGKHMEVMNTTGPVALNYLVKKRGYTYHALPAKLVMPCSVCNIDNCQIDKDTYLRPLIGSSWIGMDTKVMNFFMCNWRSVVVIGIILFILLIIIIVWWWCAPTKKRCSVADAKKGTSTQLSPRIKVEETTVTLTQ